ncbi:MAG: DUF3365 domain-containing protein [Burkholderiales bacterium]
MKKYYSTAIVLSALVVAPVIAQDANLDESRAIAVQLMQQLAAELKKELTANGPVAAIAVCQKVAPDIAQKLSLDKGWRVTRVSLKTRNPLLGEPDIWEQSALQEFDIRAAAGEALDKMERSETVTEPNGRYFRYLKALPTQPLCLTCHGSLQQIPDSVKATLKEKYPHDQATGYAQGQVRGAISIKRVIP